MSDEGMSDEIDDNGMAVVRAAMPLYENEGVPVPARLLRRVVARLDAAERERDALREAQCWRDIASAPDPTPDLPILIWVPTSHGAIRSIATSRFGQYGIGSATMWQPFPPLTANHSAPQEQQP